MDQALSLSRPRPARTFFTPLVTASLGVARAGCAQYILLCFSQHWSSHTDSACRPRRLASEEPIASACAWTAPIFAMPPAGSVRITNWPSSHDRRSGRASVVYGRDVWAELLAHICGKGVLAHWLRRASTRLARAGRSADRQHGAGGYSPLRANGAACAAARGSRLGWPSTSVNARRMGSLAFWRRARALAGAGR